MSSVAPSTTIQSREFEDISEGEDIPSLVLPVTYTKVVGLVAGTRDFFAGHHDPEYARGQGQRTIYANTMFLHGFLDRLVLEWAGPSWFIRRRLMKMETSVYAGDTLTGTGAVSKKWHEDDGTQVIEVAVQASTDDGRCVSGEVVITKSP